MAAMSPCEFKRALSRLGLSQVGFASTIGRNDKTIRDYCSGRKSVPLVVAIVLDLMLELQERDGHD
jgi:DNA-binding transcriptional regulator YiaG